VLAPLRRFWDRLRGPLRVDDLTRLSSLVTELAPLEMRFVGRTLWHMVLVGVTAGFIGAAFFAILEWLQQALLEDFVGYIPLRAHGESAAVSALEHTSSTIPWLVFIIPAVGGLLSGLVSRFVPEVAGGGADYAIDAFHHHGGFIRRRVIWAKPLASFFTLGTGGAGGREGPTMMIGAAVGSGLGRALRLGARERRILLVAGMAAGISAVFRTPLGAALLAVEVLYRDDFESDALVSCILASVVSYSIVISLYGESTLLAHAPRFPFTPSHLPLYALLAVFIAAMGHITLRVFAGMKHLLAKLPGPAWVRPAWGGLFLGIWVVPLIVLASHLIGTEGQGLGLLGGGYGAAQTAITGASWLPLGWIGVGFLFALAIAKIIASSLTIGSGGSAGDFAPSLAIGGLLGGAFGRAAQILIDPSIDPGAFALVGMGAFYGGIAHVPLSALVLVCELAGNYDLLVPLMLALGVSIVAMRRRTLYEAQVSSQRDSPSHREGAILGAFETTHVRDVMERVHDFGVFTPTTSAAEMLTALARYDWQDTFPVREAERMVGLVRADALRALAADVALADRTSASDLMQPGVFVRPDDTLRSATERLMAAGLRELVVVEGEGVETRVVGFLDEDHVTRRTLAALTHVSGPHRTQTQMPAVVISGETSRPE
jgi:CIC family chloride channel protein